MLLYELNSIAIVRCFEKGQHHLPFGCQLHIKPISGPGGWDNDPLAFVSRNGHRRIIPFKQPISSSLAMMGSFL
jgi:hypothetical protein